MATIDDITLPRTATASQVVRALRKWGAVVVPDYLDQGVVEQLLKEHKHALESPGEGINVWPSYSGKIADYNLCTADPSTFGTTFKVFRNPLFKIVAEKYIGNPFYFNYEIYATWEYETGTPIVAWHYDKIWTLKNYFYLTDTTIENGSIWFIPASHRQGRKLARKHLSKNPRWTVSVSEPHYQIFPNVIDADNYPPPVAIEAKAGSLIFFDSDTFHYASPLQPGRQRFIVRTVSCDLQPPIKTFPKFGRQWFRSIPWNPVRLFARLTTLPSGISVFDMLSAQRRAKVFAHMGDSYFFGWGFDKSLDTSFDWWNRALKNGSASAAFSMAEVYAAGESGGESAPDLAIKYWTIAADRGHVTAMSRLAQHYHEGAGVAQDTDKAISYWQQAAEGGHGLSMVELGKVHDLQQSKATSEQWFNKAYLAALDSYQKNEFSDCVAILQQLVECNSIAAINLLAECYRRGAGVEQNLSTSVTLWQKAVAQGDAVAAYAMAESYWAGLPGLPKDEAKAMEFWTTAAKLGYAPAKEKLAQAKAA